MPPFYDLKIVKAKIRSGEFELKPNAIQGAIDAFNWSPDEIKKCLLKLNARNHRSDPNNNHFFKTERHRYLPHTMIDYYKARNIMDGENIYTHLYIRIEDSKVIVNSFHELDI